MNTKTKITEIKETYTKNARVKGTTGEATFEEKSFTRYKDVPYVDGFARLRRITFFQPLKPLY